METTQTELDDERMESLQEEHEQHTQDLIEYLSN